MSFVQSLILAVVEGLTEYLPISSTGHMIVTSWLMGIHEDEFVKNYTIMVQFGAILAVVVLYWRRFVLNFHLYPKVFTAFLPAAVVGMLVKKYIDALLESVLVVGIATLIGGIILVWTGGWVKRQRPQFSQAQDLPVLSALKVGMFQLFAFIPGVSRSASTILGGLHQGMSLVAATEFSFFLAVPTLTGATLVKAMKAWPTITPDQIHMMIWGNVVSFLVGAASVHTFVTIISRYGLKSFGYYRILLGAAVIAMAFSQS